MPMHVQKRGSRFQLRVTHENLPKPFFHTFLTQEEADNNGSYLLAALDKGVVPVELLAGQPKSDNDPVLSALLRKWENEAHISRTDRDLIELVWEDVLTTRVSEVTYQWAKAYVSKLKLIKNLAPSTIRARVGVISRALSWHIAETSSGVDPAAARRLPSHAARERQRRAVRRHPGLPRSRSRARSVHHPRGLGGSAEAGRAGRFDPQHDRGHVRRAQDGLGLPG